MPNSRRQGNMVAIVRKGFLKGVMPEVVFENRKGIF
jgi:hypothetical protein